ncbi:MAG: hypothetical protein V3U76_07535 [Granulosicoccus sp.]
MTTWIGFKSCNDTGLHIPMQMIESSHWRLWLEPGQGMQWQAAAVRQDDAWVMVVPDCRQQSTKTGSTFDDHRAGQSEDSPLPAANFHMLPYSNRIRDGKFEFEGKSFQLDKADSHAIHGALRKQPWKVLEQSANSLTCHIDTRELPSVNWPWPMSSNLTYKLDGKRLLATMTLDNIGNSNMPAGMGWHPYFIRKIKGASPVLTLPVDGVFPAAAGEILPSGAAEALPAELDFRYPRALDPNQRIDCCLSGLNGDVRIDWPDAALALNMHCSELCRYLVFFNPNMPHFAVEPVTNATDAFNLEQRGIAAGIRVLAPGESLSASMELLLETN